MTKTPSGLEYEDTQVGTGASPTRGKTCVMHYTGWLWVNGAKGAKFDSSVDRGEPFEFAIGVGQVIKGWDEGVMSMQVGEHRAPQVALLDRRAAAALVARADAPVDDPHQLPGGEKPVDRPECPAQQGAAAPADSGDVENGYVVLVQVAS